MVKKYCLVFIKLLGLLSVGGHLFAELSPRALKDPEKSLARSRDPLSLVEEFLIIQDTGTVANYLVYLNKKGKDALADRVRYLEELYAGNNAGAMQVLEKMEKNDSWFVTRTKEINRLMEIHKTFIETKSDHFLVRTPAEDAFLAPYAMPSLESAYGRVAQLFGSSSTLPTVIEIYPTLDQFAVASAMPQEEIEQTGSTSRTYHGRLMLLSPGATSFGYRWIDELMAEYIYSHLTRITGGRCPGWLQVGTARYLEVAWQRPDGFVHSPSDRALLTRTVLNGSGTPLALLPLNKIDPASMKIFSQTQRRVAMAEAVDAVDFIVQEFGIEKLVNLLHSFREMTHNEAFEKILILGEKDIEKNWRDSLVNLTEVPIDLARGSLGETIHFGGGDDLCLVEGEEVKEWLKEGDQLGRKGLFDNAAVKYKKAIENEPDNGVALARLAQVYRETQKIQSAEELLNHAMEKNSSYAIPFILMGEIYFDEGRYEEAQQALQHAIEISPFQAKPHELLGRIAVDVGNFELAKQSLTLALRFDPANKSVRELLQHLPKPR